jgi:hypothetical protein
MDFARTDISGFEYAYLGWMGVFKRVQHAGVHGKIGIVYSYQFFQPGGLPEGKTIWST